MMAIEILLGLLIAVAVGCCLTLVCQVVRFIYVDAVEVVRCYRCMHWHEVEEMEGGGYCNHPRFHIDNAEPPIVQAADFCSYGERSK